jgi:pyruvate/2-oxoacid:ferredoxin oxidoreductase alpha subunit
MIDPNEIEIWTGNQAIAEAVIRCKPKVVAAYPITPSTPIIEFLSDAVENGRIDGQYISVESEHAAMSGTIGASLAGARTFTATASQGLLYMMEMIYFAGFSRLPMTIALVNRAVYGGWTIWADHQDMYSMRDAGWLQLIAKNNQEAHDLIPQSFKISEHHDIFMPSAVNLDGFVLSHVAGQVEPLPQKLVDDFLPDFVPMFELDPKDPISFGSLTLPKDYLALRQDHVDSMERAKGMIKKVSQEFTDLTGRYWGDLVEIYGSEQAEVGIISMGTLAEETEEAVDYLNSKGGHYGATRIRSLRPFPKKEIQEASKRYDRIIVLDRGYSFGSSPPLVTEVRNALYQSHADIPVDSIIIGIGGEEVSYKDIAGAVTQNLMEVEN